MKRGVGRRFGERFSDLKPIKGSEEDVFGSVVQTNKVRKAGGVCTSRKTIYKLYQLKREMPEVRYLRTIKRWKTCFLEDGISKISMPVADGLELTRARKLIEIVTAGTTLKVTITKRRKETEELRKVKMRREGAVVIKAGEKTYAELLKEIKNDIKAAGKDIEVTKVRRTMKGDILLHVGGGEAGAKKARDMLKEVTWNKIELAANREKKTLYVLGADGVTTKEEVEEDIRAQFAVEGEMEIRVTSTKRAFGDTQNFTVKTDRETASRMIDKGSLKVGWVNCKVKERVDVARCYKCHEFGHTRVTCGGPDRGDKYLRCGGEGHIVKFCRKEHKEYCFSCGVEGHRNSSTKCPVYVKLLDAVRARGKKKASQKARW